MDVLKIKDLRWGNIHIGGKKKKYTCTYRMFC
jgi:hypothetical protein